MILIQKTGNMNMFDVYLVDLDLTRGAEMKKVRPAIIISPSPMNKNLKTVIIAPITYTIKGYPSRVTIHFNNQVSDVVLDQIRAIDKSRLKKKMGAIDASTAQKIRKILRTMFS
jgi:mRNA interferase MazF